MMNAKSRPASRSPKLDAINDALADEKTPRRLHPTRGFRKLNVKRDRASLVVAAIKNGERWPMDRIRSFLANG
jgi:hypothetical protein